MGLGDRVLVSDYLGETTAAMLVLKNEEEQLIKEIGAALESHKAEEARLISERFDCLRNLGNAISQYTSVRLTNCLKSEGRDDKKILDFFRSFSYAAYHLVIPARVMAARSYLVAKFQTFSLLTGMVEDMSDFRERLKKVIFTIICTLMTEDVYMSCLDDQGFPDRVKIRLVYDLLFLWDTGTDPHLIQHMPAMERLWQARDAAPPSFGTLDGNSELLRITMDMGGDWREFLVDQSADEETQWALEEFLFGLSYEEINALRAKLKHRGISAVSYDEIHSFLGANPAYKIASGSDPQAIYEFYVDRREAAHFRGRISQPGPRKTLEELYMKYRIARTSNLEFQKDAKVSPWERRGGTAAG